MTKILKNMESIEKPVKCTNLSFKKYHFKKERARGHRAGFKQYTKNPKGNRTAKFIDHQEIQDRYYESSLNLV